MVAFLPPWCIRVKQLVAKRRVRASSSLSVHCHCFFWVSATLTATKLALGRAARPVLAVEPPPGPLRLPHYSQQPLLCV